MLLADPPERHLADRFASLAPRLQACRSAFETMRLIQELFVEGDPVMLGTALATSLVKSQKLVDKLALLNRDIDREMRQVGELQRSLLPNPLRGIPGMELAVSYEPSGRAGGDLYDFFPLDADIAPPTRWCIFIGDAAGHGMAASVVIAIVQSILHAHPVPVTGPAELLAYINRQLCRKRLDGFVTCFLAFFEPGTRQLTYASAGHPPPLRKAREDCAVSRLDAAPGYPLGIDASLAFAEASVQLHRGDTLLLYTDGITEARGREKEWFDIRSLELALRCDDSRPSQAIRKFADLIRNYQGCDTPVDDQTMVIARIA